MSLELTKVPLGEHISRSDNVLFSESNTRFLVEVAPEDRKRFEKVMDATASAVIGEVAEESRLAIYGVRGEKLVMAPLAELKEAWQQPLRW